MKAFIDTNVLIYWVDSGPRADTVEQLLAGDCTISVQVLNEFANVLTKKRAMTLAAIGELSDTLIATCQVHDLTVRTHQVALTLMGKYRFSLYDANIVAAAGLSGCNVLYSEDMQDGLNVTFPKTIRGLADVSLSIRTPF